MIGAVAAVLASRLAAGTLLAAGCIGWRHPVPDRFLRFLLDSAAGLFALALLLGWHRPEAAYWGGLLTLSLALAVGLRLVPPRLESSRRQAAAAMAALGLAGALAPWWLVFPSASEIATGGVPLAMAANLAAAGLLGATTATMVLGHWYLVDTALSIRPLAFGAALLLGATGLRVSITAVSLAASGAAALRLSTPSDLIYSTTALFFSFRAITGLMAPAALCLLVRSTVRIRSTQSATGLLYVALILVLFGELTAVFLEQVTGGALV